MLSKFLQLILGISAPLSPEMTSVSLHQVSFFSYVNLNKSDLVIFYYVI